MTVFLTSTHWK